MRPVLVWAPGVFTVPARKSDARKSDIDQASPCPWPWAGPPEHVVTFGDEPAASVYRPSVYRPSVRPVHADFLGLRLATHF
jgi:hypothetical protein